MGVACSAPSSSSLPEEGESESSEKVFRGEAGLPNDEKVFHPTPHAILVHPPPVGTVEVFPSGPAPHTFQWGMEQGCEAKQEKGGTLLTCAREGSYSLLVKDGNGSEMDVSFQVTPLPLPSLERYEVVSHCTSDHSRDGAVRALLSCPVREGWGLLWSCGVLTEGDTLSDVRPGSYSATLVRTTGRKGEDDADAEWKGFLHLPSSPAVVEVR